MVVGSSAAAAVGTIVGTARAKVSAQANPRAVVPARARDVESLFNAVTSLSWSGESQACDRVRACDGDEQ